MGIRASRSVKVVVMSKLCGVLLLVLCGCVQIFAIPPEVKEKLPQEILDMIYYFRGKCAPQFGLTDADIDNYQIGNDDEKFRCYMNCLLLEAKWMDPDGKIHYDHILGNIHIDVVDILEAAFAKCREFPDHPEKCGRAYGFNLCLSKADPVHYFLP